MKRKWWIAAGILVLCALLLLAYPVRLRLFPRWMLSRALGSALEQLEDRFEYSPVRLISAALDPQGNQRSSVQLETEDNLLGIVRYDMLLCTQLSPSRIQADGTVVTGGKLWNLSLYLDGDFAAVSSRDLMDGGYYGIAYDTFSRDIRSRQLLATLIGEKTIRRWEQSVLALDEAMSRELKLPELRTEDVVSALYGILALKPQVSRVHTPAVGSRYAYAVSFRVNVQEIARMAESHRDEIPEELLHKLNDLKKESSAVIQIEFLLSCGKLVQLQAELDSPQGYTRVSLVLGEKPDEAPLNIELIAGTGEDCSRTWVEIQTASGEETYREQISISKTQNDLNSILSLDYSYDQDTGEIDLGILRKGNKARVRLNLSGEGKSVTIRSQNLRPVINLFSDKEGENPVICTMVISPGKTVSVPKYRSLDQWSLEDLYSLLSSLGDLMGLKLQ